MKTTAQLTIEIFESLGMTDKQAWEMMNKKAKENGFDSYAGMPNVTNTSATLQGSLVEVGEIKKQIKKLKKDKKYTYPQIADEIEKLTGIRISIYNLASLSKSRYIREGLFDVLSKLLCHYGYDVPQKITKDYTANYIIDKNMRDRLQKYKNDNKLRIVDVVAKINAKIRKNDVTEGLIRGIIIDKRTRFVPKKYKILNDFLKGEGY